MGSACTALTVAVLAKKLELTSPQRHVIQFVDLHAAEVGKKHCAATIIREGCSLPCAFYHSSNFSWLLPNSIKK